MKNYSKDRDRGGKGPVLLDERIKASEIRLVTEDGQAQIVSREEAERMAEEQGLDLIIVSLESSPPVVRLMDFGKYKFQKEKKAREAKKKQHVIDIKELKVGVRIDTHDYEVKRRRAQEFLESGNKVKLTIRLRGREVQHDNLAFDLANRFVVDLEEFGTVESKPRLEGRQVTFMLAPQKKKT